MSLSPYDVCNLKILYQPSRNIVISTSDWPSLASDYYRTYYAILVFRPWEIELKSGALDMRLIENVYGE